mmetsp:Transcript_31037/g.103366  ORF Transcript_31037/g.103366 Transcript_31037/m.103366 type:complete len:116 (-) Transcript_31037:182-529(-)
MARPHHHHHHFGQAPLSAASTGSPSGVSKEDGVEMLQALFPNTRISVKQVPPASTGMPRPPMTLPFGATGMPGGGLLGAAGFLGGGLGSRSCSSELSHLSLIPSLKHVSFHIFTA